MLGEAVTTRLATGVPAIAGRIGTAAQFADVVQRNAFAQQTPAAFVLPLGLRGGAADAATGIFRQALLRFVGIVLVVRAVSDPLGTRAAEELVPLIEDTISALCGWAPGDEVGVFRLARGELLSMAGGACIYQLDFILEDQLRI